MSALDKLDELISQHEDQKRDALNRLQKAQAKVIEAQDALKEVEHRLNGLILAKEAMAGAFSVQKPQRTRSLSSTWKRILSFIAVDGQAGKTVIEIKDFVHRQGIDLDDSAIRSQLSNYTKAGLLEAMGEGSYKITPKGTVMIASEVGPNN